MKTFRDFTEEEKMAWAKQFQSFVTNRLDSLKSGKDFDKELFLEGMALIEPWPCSIYFCRDARMFRDYHARVPLLFQMFRQVQEDAKNIIARYSKTIADAADTLSQAKVGKPTKAINDALDTLGAKHPKNKHDARLVVTPEMKDKLTSGQLDLWQTLPSTPVREEANDAANHHGDGSDGGEVKCVETEPTIGTVPVVGKALRDVAWLLSSDLVARIDTVAALRGEAATNAEMAKMLAKKGGKQGDIEDYAQAAAEKTQEYLAIYREVDEELAMLYIANRINANYHGIETKAHEHGISSANLMGKVLMPYYKKVKAEDETFENRVLMQVQKELSAPKVDENGKVVMSSKEKSQLRQRARSYFNACGKREKENITEEMIQRMTDYVLQLKENDIEYKDLEVKLRMYKPESNSFNESVQRTITGK